ncbi:MAG: 23S rRNA (guanosine(2251)-2'-O)-methyltransferase RlmB [Clostridia bacterium]|nr:23S rRNA (guanosine(2251)-2'-O)-methyltransferase RlmB [Clostridia bacterium]
MKVEGKNSVRELLKTDADIDKILVQNGLKDAESKKIIALMRDRRVKIQFADSFVLDKESEKRMHQGFIAFVSDYKYSSIESIIKLASSKDDSIVIVLDEISDPHNLGSIIRVAECGGVDGIIIPERRSAQVNDTVMRISEGGANHVKIARVVNLNTAIEKLKDNGFWVTGAELGGEDLYKADLTGKLCLVIGSEGFGIRKLVKENCDRIVTIPMRGKVNSLNASVACGIVLFEALRQRNGK